MIKFFGHASFLVKSKNFNLLVDPWFSGSAFDKGWDLLSPPHIDPTELKIITHIWYSHEHPDHFSIQDLNFIHKINNKIKIIFQNTKDKRVLNFLRKRGFEVIEADNYQKYYFDDDCYIQIIKCGLIDSFAIIKYDNNVIVNMNDCVPGRDLSKIQKVIDTLKIDILFTQFSYADWNGNESDIDLRKKAVKNKMKQVLQQINFFKPKFVCPFASYIFFSHEENFFMNDAIANIKDVNDYIINHSDALPVILYPGENFNYTNKNNSDSINKYIKDALDIRVIHKSKVILFDELIYLSRLQILKIKRYNGWIFILFFYLIGKYFKKGIKPINFFVRDLNIFFSYDIFNGLKKTTHKDINLIINSEVLGSILKNDWGIGTTLVNGRFFLKDIKFLDGFRSAFCIPLLNSNGLTILRFYLNKFFKKDTKIQDYQFTLLLK